MKHLSKLIVVGLVVAIVAAAYAITRTPKPENTQSTYEEATAAEQQPPPLAASEEEAEEIDWSQVDWKERLTDFQYYVTREGGTERAFANAYWDNKRPGVYHCVCCDLPLFSSEAKYESGSGWPSFYEPIDDDAVTAHEDNTFFMTRVETRCRRCDAHLGHVFEDGPEPTGLRYCMNSAALRFVEAEDRSEHTEIKEEETN